MTQTVTGHVRATIVRPRPSRFYLIQQAVGLVLAFIIKAGALWWLLPLFTPWHLTYDQCLAAVLLLAVLRSESPAADYWTEAPR